MEKKEIISVLQDVRDSHVVWVKQGQIIVDGIKLDRLEEPVPYSECEFTHWCESSTDKISAFPWVQEIQEMHVKLHQSYSDMFFGSIRKYKPKTLNELTESFDLLKTESKSFKEKLDQTESELYQMSDDVFEDLVEKSNSDHDAEVTKTTSGDAGESTDDNNANESNHNNDEVTANDTAETEDIESKQSDNDSMMKEVDIHRYDSYRNPFDELESITSFETVKKDETAIEEKVEVDETLVADDATLKSANDEPKPAINSVVNFNRHISLKERNIIQLNQEKALISLELTHLEEKQKLTQQSVEQLEQYYSFKQEEVELEQKDNGGFIDFKNNAKKQVENDLTDIQEKQSDLKNVINDLEKQNVEDQMIKDEDKKEESIEKQFEELKFNKNKNLEELQEHKESRENDLIKLKEQVALLEEELSDMDQDFDKKQQDLLDFEEKDKLKNEERSMQKTEQEKLQQVRNDKIIDTQKELEQLSDGEQNKRNELNTIAYQIEELNKNSTALIEANSEQLKDLEQQKELKQEKLQDSEELKSSKQQEIKNIEIRIVGLERSLAELKADQDKAEDKQSAADLVTSE